MSGIVTPARRRSRALSRLRANPLAVAGAVAVGVFVLAALAAPLLAPYSPIAPDFDAVLAQPSLAHWLGTDDLGRDQLSRILFGLRASLQVGLLAVIGAAVIGIATGMLAGYYGGVIDMIASRLTDALLAFPFLILAVGLAAILGPSLTNATLAVAISLVPAFFRVARGEALRLRGGEYVQAAIASGSRPVTALAQHVLPNAASALIVQTTIAIPGAILAEAVLSFLGLGVQPPTPSLGTMLSAAQSFLYPAPWMAVFPGLAIVALTLAFNVLGDGVRDALDPKGDGR
ncbi:ABC transporter permease [Naumannella huperziae]